MKNKFFLLFIVLFLVLFFASFASAGLFNFDGTCGDGTLNGECSEYKSYFCSKGKLVEEPLTCGCPEGFELKDEECFSEFQKNPKTINLNYVLRGEEGNIEMTVYEGLTEYLFSLPNEIEYSEEEESRRVDFKLRAVDEPVQRSFLIPLAVEIQNLDKDKIDQARIAISLVQNLEFGYSGETVNFGPYEVNYSRYPYATLYDMQGVCGEKSELLIFLLREIGYETVFFYNQQENHESVGVKCPVEYSLGGTGYCFIETTAPSVITNSQNQYIDGQKIISDPEVSLISEGDSFGEDLYEYRDAKTEIRINNILQEGRGLNFLRYLQAKRLNRFYGLED